MLLGNKFLELFCPVKLKLYSPWTHPTSAPPPAEPEGHEPHVIWTHVSTWGKHCSYDERPRGLQGPAQKSSRRVGGLAPRKVSSRKYVMVSNAFPDLILRAQCGHRIQSWTRGQLSPKSQVGTSWRRKLHFSTLDQVLEIFLKDPKAGWESYKLGLEEWLPQVFI